MNPTKSPASLARNPKWEVADIFRQYRRLLGPLQEGEAKVVRDIIDCRTAKLGGHVRECSDCGNQEISYNSCRNRHCPKCQFLARAEWVENRVDELLPVEYFHVVFTLPHELNPLILQNKRMLYNLLFDAASQTLKEVSVRHLKAETGFIAVLHTWDQKLSDHPHIHMIVPGGGLRENEDGTDQWVSFKRGYLLPISILTKVYRGKFLSALEALHGELKFSGRTERLKEKSRFKKLLQSVARKNWVVYAKSPFAGPKQVIQYLGNYTHRVAISNYRILKVENDHVYFRYRDSAQNNKHLVMCLHVTEFMRRYLLHVLPRRFIRIRHYGFLGNRSRTSKIERLKALLIPNTSPPKKENSEATKKDWKERLKELTGLDLSVCSVCKKGEMKDIRRIPSRYELSRALHHRKAWDTS